MLTKKAKTYIALVMVAIITIIFSLSLVTNDFIISAFTKQEVAPSQNLSQIFNPPTSQEGSLQESLLSTEDGHSTQLVASINKKKVPVPCLGVCRLSAEQKKRAIKCGGSLGAALITGHPAAIIGAAFGCW